MTATNGDMLREVLGELENIRGDVKRLADSVGDENHGLVRQMRELQDLKQRGIGVFLAATLFGSVLLLGVKTWLQDLLKGFAT